MSPVGVVREGHLLNWGRLGVLDGARFEDLEYN